MRWTMGAVCVTAFVFTFVRPAYAQPVAMPDELGSEVRDVSLGGTPVSLEALLEYAERSAPALAIAEAEVGLASEDFGVAEPLLPDNPTLQAGLGPRLAATTNGAMDLNVQVQLLQPFEIAGQRPLRFDVARAARATREASLERARWQVHQQIHAGYRAALAAQRNTEIVRRLADFAARLVEIAHRRVQAGDVAPLIERLAEADAAQARERAVAAFQGYRDACLALAEVAGWPVASPPEPIGDLPAPRRAPPLARLAELAREHNPELLVGRAAVDEANLRVDLAHRDAVPDPQLGFQYGYEGAPNGGTPEHVIMAMLQIEIPSFALNQAARARTAAERDVAEARRDALSSVVEVRLERLRSAVDAAAERVESYGSDILPRFEENLTMLRRAFDLGEIDLLRVSLALERFLDVQQQALGAHVDFFAAVAALEAQIGEEIWGHEVGAQ